MVPYFRTDMLKPGEYWHQMPTDGKYTEHYVQLAEGPAPVGVVIARKLIEMGAIAAACTDLTLGRMKLIGGDFRCLVAEGCLGELLDQLRAANEGKWAGLSDAIGIFGDGRVALREAKVAGKDPLSRAQHGFARVAQELLGDRLDLAVVEWSYEEAP
jgi:hypothetical protein